MGIRCAMALIGNAKQKPRVREMVVQLKLAKLKLTELAATTLSILLSEN